MVQNTLSQRAQQAARRPRLDNRRLWAVLCVFVVFGLYNSQKLFSLQVLQYSDLSDKAELRIRWKDVIPPKRGLIYDSHEQLLAGNTTAQDVYVDKAHSDELNMFEISNLLAPVLGQQAGDMYNRLKNTDSTNIRVASLIDDATASKVRQLIDDHEKTLLYKVRFETKPKRQYPSEFSPDHTLAASLLGFTDHENQGHYGVEEFYNSKLAGKAGWILAEHDAEGRPLVFQQPQMEPAEDGSDLVLTLDSAIQYMAERELKNSLEEYKAESGYIIVQDPNTGGILALANAPSFNPNNFNKYTNYELFKNPVVNDVREPGSTMKVLTYASSIDGGAITPDTRVYCNGYLLRFGQPLWNATRTAYGWETMTQGLGRSDNVASMFAAEQLGQPQFYEYMHSFGIGKRTGIDLAGEVAGLTSFPDDEGFSPINLFTNSYGQGVATTPIQLISAVSAVANGGVLLKPHVMKEIREDGKVTDTFETEEMRRVIKPQTASQIADMLATGVENKMVARFSAVPGYHVSVKTGTAQLAENGGYTGDGSFASAIGFAPSHNAKFTMYIGILNPRTSQWGENTASRSWGRLAKELLMYMKVQPTEPLPTSTPTP